MIGAFRKAMIALNHSHEKLIAPIIADGSLATVGVGDGRMFPWSSSTPRSVPISTRRSQLTTMGRRETSGSSGVGFRTVRRR